MRSPNADRTPPAGRRRRWGKLADIAGRCGLKFVRVQIQLPLISPDSPPVDQYYEDGADLALDDSDNNGIDFIVKIAGFAFGGRSFGVQIDAR